jgi:hypothetical protein
MKHAFLLGPDSKFVNTKLQGGNQSIMFRSSSSATTCSSDIPAGDFNWPDLLMVFDKPAPSTDVTIIAPYGGSWGESEIFKGTRSSNTACLIGERILSVQGFLEDVNQTIDKDQLTCSGNEVRPMQQTVHAFI